MNRPRVGGVRRYRLVVVCIALHCTRCTGEQEPLCGAGGHGDFAPASAPQVGTGLGRFLPGVVPYQEVRLLTLLPGTEPSPAGSACHDLMSSVIVQRGAEQPVCLHCFSLLQGSV